MSRLVPITSYLVRFAACSAGFNEWRKNIVIRTQDPATSCNIRFVDDPASLPATWEKVTENGWSQVYLPANQFSGLLELLRTEKPLFLVLYADAKKALVQTGPEPPGEEEPQ